MNDTTDKLIRELAAKLGTTAEHLWQVMVAQAPISAWTNLTLLMLMILGTVGTFMWTHALHKKHEGEEWVVGVWMGWAFLLLVTIILVGCYAEGVVTGLFNPEFWALSQLLPSK